MVRAAAAAGGMVWSISVSWYAFSSNISSSSRDSLLLQGMLGDGEWVSGGRAHRKRGKLNTWITAVLSGCLTDTEGQWTSRRHQESFWDILITQHVFCDSSHFILQHVETQHIEIQTDMQSVHTQESLCLQIHLGEEKKTSPLFSLWTESCFVFLLFCLFFIFQYSSYFYTNHQGKYRRGAFLQTTDMMNLYGSLCFTVLMFWLFLGTESSWLEFGKYHVLA